MENAGVNKDLIPGATAPEGVMDGTPEITEDNLSDLLLDGSITLEQANEFIRAQEEAPTGESETKGVSPESEGAAFEAKEVGNPVPENNNAPDMGGVVSDEGKPFRVYNSQEEFQRDFDRSWNKRHAKEKAEREAKDAELDELLTSLGALLGVPKENAKEELTKRQRTLEAESKGEDPDSYIARRAAEDERDKLQAQIDSDNRAKEGAALVADIRGQGEAIGAYDKSFDIDAAMENPEFKRCVFSLYRAFPGKAVEMAYNTVYKKAAVTPPTVNAVPAVTAPAQTRPAEGAATAATTGARKPVDFSAMSSADILAMEKEIMKGKKIEI